LHAAEFRVQALACSLSMKFCCDKRQSRTRLRIQQPASPKSLSQQRFDLTSDVLVCIAHPCYVGFEIQWCPKRLTQRVGYNHAHFSGDQLGTQVVWMAAYSMSEASLIEDRLHERSQVCSETIVTGNQFVELSAARQVLIFEAVSLAGLDISECASR